MQMNACQCTHKLTSTTTMSFCGTTSARAALALPVQKHLSVSVRLQMTARRKPALTSCSRGNRTLRSPAPEIACSEPEQCEHQDQWHTRHDQWLPPLGSHLMRSSTKVLGLLCVMVAMACGEGDEELSLKPRNVSRARVIRPPTVKRAVLLPCEALLRRGGILAEAFQAVILRFLSPGKLQATCVHPTVVNWPQTCAPCRYCPALYKPDAILHWLMSDAHGNTTLSKQNIEQRLQDPGMARKCEARGPIHFCYSWVWWVRGWLLAGSVDGYKLRRLVFCMTVSILVPDIGHGPAVAAHQLQAADCRTPSQAMQLLRPSWRW